MAYQGSCSAVLKGERRHHEIHLEEDASVIGNDGRHAFSHGNSAPNITVQIHKSVVTEWQKERADSLFQNALLSKDLSLVYAAAVILPTDFKNELLNDRTFFERFSLYS